MQRVLITNEMMAEINTAPITFVNLNVEEQGVQENIWIKER
jgi:hypothetical protein